MCSFQHLQTDIDTIYITCLPNGDATTTHRVNSIMKNVKQKLYKQNDSRSDQQTTQRISPYYEE